MRAVAYCRVSTDQQADGGVSLAAQQQRVAGYAQAFDIIVVEVVTDAGHSAKTLDRPGLQRALGMLRTGEANALLVPKLDRLTRSVKDLALLLETQFSDGRSALISVSENIDTASAAGRLVLNVLCSVGQWEREAVGERTREALAHLRNQGIRLGAAPLGHRYTADVDADGRRTLVPDPAEQRALRRITELRRHGLTLRAIAAVLEHEGLRARRGRWHAQTVHRALQRFRSIAPPQGEQVNK